MPRLRNIQSGVVVSVTAEKAARMGAGWKPVEPKTSAKKVASKKSDK